MTTHAKKAEIRMLGGTPTLFIAGEPHTGLAYMTFHPDRGRYADFARAGVDLVSFSTTCDFHLYGLAEPTWLAPGVYDYTPLDRLVARILSEHPKAWLLPRVFVGSPPWWDEAHPDELVRYADGSTRKPLHEDARKLTVASFSSTAWRRDSGEALAKLVQYLRQCDYADRIVGIHLASAETEEWFYCGTYQGFFSDYSEPHRRAFGEWLRVRYRDEKRLADAWGRAVRFEDVVVPSEEKRRARECFSLRDPRAARDVIDYTIFRGEDVASAIAHFARIVKTESSRELLCGAFYGYLMELSLHPNGLHLGGHGGLGALLRSPDVDFLSSPTSYFNRKVSGGETHFMSIPDSIRLHGKLWFNENDIRTHVLPENAGYGRTSTLDETIAVQRREFAHSLSRGAGMWWFDMTGGWYEEPEVMAEISQLNDIARESLATSRTSVSEIAVFVDPEGLAGLAHGNEVGLPLLRLQLSQLGWVGAPFDLYLLEDLPRVRPYRVYLFLSPLAIEGRVRDFVRGDLRRGGRVSIWVFAPGVGSAGLSASGILPVTGIACRRLDEERKLEIEVDAGSHPIGRGLPAGLRYGTIAPVGPVFVVDDPRATVLGRLVPGGEPALAVQSHDGWTSVFSASPNLPASLVRSCLRFAGGHVYTSGDALVWANRSYVAAQPWDPRVTSVRLPEGAVVHDLFAEGNGTGERVFEAPIDPSPERVTLLRRE